MKDKMKNLRKKISVFGVAIATAGITFPATLCTLPVESVFAAGDVMINATNFPDKKFRSYVLKKIDKDNNKKLSSTEISKVKEIDVVGMGINSLKGIEYFKGLTGLFCGGNNLKSLDLSQNKKLDALNCGNSEDMNNVKLTNLNVSNNTELTTLACFNQNLTELNLSNNKKLKYLYCSDNKLKHLDVSDSEELVLIECSNNNLNHLNVNKNTKLHSLRCWNNNLESLDITNNKNLEDLKFVGKKFKELVMLKKQKVSVIGSDNADYWKSENTKIATVSARDDIVLSFYADINAVGEGTTVITSLNNSGKQVDSFKVTAKKSPTSIKNGWVKENGGFKYYKNGKAYTGWHKMGKAEGEKTPHWSYFGKDGKIYTGWHKMGKNEGEKTAHWSYFGDNGWLRTGWQQMGKGTSNPDGNAVKHWSYFGDNGWLRTGWQNMGKGTNNPDGNSAKHVSYFGNNGWLRTGLQDMGKGTNNPDGNAAKHKSYFGNNGWLVTNKKITVSGKNYQADGRGWLSEIKQTTTAKSGTSRSGNSATATSGTYILNTNSGIFHRSNCSSVKKMSASNKAGCSSRQEAINKGYKPCKNCNP